MALMVTPPGPRTFIDQPTNPLTFVTFTVTNTDPLNNCILDFAAEIISPPAESDDQALIKASCRLRSGGQPDRFILG